METPNGITIEPIVWPKVKIGKQILEVRWGLVAEYLISLWGIEVDDLLALYRRKMITPPVFEEDGKTIKTNATFEPMPAQWLVKFFDLFAACVGHAYIQLGQEAPRGFHWVTQVDEDQGQFATLFSAVTEAMGKRQTTAKKAPAPPKELATEQEAPTVQ